MFTTDDVKKIAKLSRLHLTDAEINAYQTQLGSILSYVDKLQSVETEGVAELQHAVPMENVLRTDEAACDVDARQKSIDLFSNKKEDLLEVQAVFEGKE